LLTPNLRGKKNMTQQIVNAAPMVIDYGTQDLSTRLLPREQEHIPQHLPKFYIFAEKGPLTPELVVGNERILTYGMNTFDLRGKYANHSTVFANLVNAQGNACMIQRVIAADAGPEANLIAWLDVLPVLMDDYERNIDGSIKVTALGDSIIIGSIQGYKVKWVVTNRNTVVGMDTYGQLNITAGDQIDPVANTISQRYPIFEMKTSSLGEYGNSCGIRLWAPTIDTISSMPTKMMTAAKAYPFFVSMIQKPSVTSSPKVVSTIYGEQRTMVTFKKDVIDPLTDGLLNINDVLIDAYQNITDLRYAKLYGDFSDIKIYDDNLDALLTMFHLAEVPFIDSFSDFTADTEDRHLFNFVTGVSSFNVPYHSFIFVDSANSVRFSEHTNVFAAGGSNGTMNHTTHANLVTDEINRYLDPNDELQELALNVESIIYDTGFPLATKYAIASFIALRKDTFVVLSTHDVEDRILTASEEHSLAIALRTRLQMFPESDYFGTPVMRAMIIGRSGKLRNSQYTKHLPLSAEVAIKAAKYMGASNGIWKNGSHFDGAPGSIVDYMYDINITWVPASVRNRNWDIGLNWVQSYDKRSHFFPAFKTIYDNDTSVLNSFFTAMAIAQLNKVAHASWREFSGISHLTNAQLASRVNDFIIARTRGRFDERFVIQPDTFFTDMDILRGFSWTLPIKIYAANMKTVLTTYVQAYRIEDIATN
jgi:hypothetical protein